MTGADAFATMGMLLLFYLAFIGIMFAIWIMCIIEIASNEYKGENTKVIWLLIVIFTGPVGEILYLTIGRSKKLPKQQKRAQQVNAIELPKADKKGKFDIS